MIFIYVFCSTNSFFVWLQNHLIPCPFKAITGVDCPGCGFQRSFIYLLKGDFKNSWDLYPPTIPLIILFTYAALFSIIPFKNHPVTLKIMAIITGNFMLISYLYKMMLK